MNAAKATLTPRRSYDVRVGAVSLGRFDVVSTWECFEKLKHTTTDEVILVTTADLDRPLSLAFQRFIGLGDVASLDPLDAEIVAASPRLAALLQGAPRGSENHGG